MKTVYAVSQGSYSDYRVEVLFESREQAELIAAENNDYFSDKRVEEFLLYDEGEMPTKMAEYSLVCEIFDAGIVQERDPGITVEYPWAFWSGTPTERPKVRYVRAPIHKDKGGRLEVRGSNKQAVQQAYSDNKARILSVGGKTLVNEEKEYTE